MISPRAAITRSVSAVRISGSVTFSRRATLASVSPLNSCHRAPYHGDFVRTEAERLQTTGGGPVIRLFRENFRAALVGVVIADRIAAEPELLELVRGCTAQKLRAHQSGQQTFFGYPSNGAPESGGILARVTYRSISPCFPWFVTAAMYFIIIFDASVLPAPDSPEIMMQVSLLRCFSTRYAASAMAKMCGAFSNSSRPLYRFTYSGP
uniref:Uncharacterized protein n=1 Tax=Anopheles farauti TaxID=69004 RepID=A0A182QMY6_9DIPT